MTSPVNDEVLKFARLRTKVLGMLTFLSMPYRDIYAVIDESERQILPDVLRSLEEEGFVRQSEYDDERYVTRSSKGN